MPVLSTGKFQTFISYNTNYGTAPRIASESLHKGIRNFNIYKMEPKSRNNLENKKSMPKNA